METVVATWVREFEEARAREYWQEIGRVRACPFARPFFTTDGATMYRVMCDRCLRFTGWAKRFDHGRTHVRADMCCGRMVLFNDDLVN